MHRMMRAELRRPAFWIACAALVMSTIGTAAATGRIGSAQIENGSIRGADVANSQIFSRHIRNGNVNAVDLANGSVTTAKLRNGAVSGAKIQHGTITSKHLAEGVKVDSHQLAEGSVTAAQIATGAVKPEALDPSLARLHQFGAAADPGDASKEIFSHSGFRYVMECTADGGGHRTAKLRVERIDGTSNWGIGGSTTYLFRIDGGDVVEPIGVGGQPAHELASSTTANYGQVLEIFLGAGTQGHRVSAIIANNYMGEERCGVFGTITPFSAQ